MTAAAKPAERKKRTITEIRDSKHTGEKMVYTSVLDYTSAKWAEAAGVDVCVVGDSLAMTCHGHPSTIPATMDMMVLHSQAVRRGAPNTFVLGCMPYQSYHTVDRALANATRFMQEALVDAVKPQGGKSQAHILKALVDAGIPTASHIGLTPHTIAMFGGFKIQGRTAEAAMKILEDALAIQDAGCFMLEFEAVPAKIAKVISAAARDPHHRHRRRRRHRRADPALLRPPRRVHRLQAEVHQALREHDRGGGGGAEGLRRGRQGGHVPRRRPQLRRRRQGVREIPRPRAKSAGTRSAAALAPARRRRHRRAADAHRPRLHGARGDDRAPGAAAGQRGVRGDAVRAARHRPHADPRGAAAPRARAPGADPPAPRRDRLRHQRQGAAAAARGAARDRAPRGAGAPRAGRPPRSARASPSWRRRSSAPRGRTTTSRSCASTATSTSGASRRRGTSSRPRRCS